MGLNKSKLMKVIVFLFDMFFCGRVAKKLGIIGMLRVRYIQFIFEFLQFHLASLAVHCLLFLVVLTTVLLAVMIAMLYFGAYWFCR